jgi:hypothetical protein
VIEYFLVLPCMYMLEITTCVSTMRGAWKVAARRRTAVTERPGLPLVSRASCRAYGEVHRQELEHY